MLRRIWHVLVINHLLQGFFAGRESEAEPVVLESSHGHDLEVEPVLTTLGDTWQSNQQHALLESSPLPTPANAPLQTVANATASFGSKYARSSGLALPIAMTFFVVAFVSGATLFHDETYPYMTAYTRSRAAASAL